MLNFTEYMLPAYWASALINEDYTGLDDVEVDVLNSWLEDTNPGWCVDVEGEPEFKTRHDANGYVLACDCVRFTFQRP